MTFLLAGRYLPRRLARPAVITMSLPHLLRRHARPRAGDRVLLPRPAAARGRRPSVAATGCCWSASSALGWYSALLHHLRDAARSGAGALVLLVWNSCAGRSGCATVPRRGVETRRLVLLHPALLVLLAVTSWTWAGPVTDTGGHATEVARDDDRRGAGAGRGHPGSSDLGYSLFSRSDVGPRDRLDLFVDETMELRKTAPPAELLIRKPGRPELRPESCPRAGPRSRRSATGRSRPVSMPARRSPSLRLGCAALIQVLLVIGLLWLVRRREPVATLQDDDATPGTGNGQREIPDEAVFLTFGAVAALGVVVLIPKLSVDYGVLRALQQTLLSSGRSSRWACGSSYATGGRLPPRSPSSSRWACCWCSAARSPRCSAATREGWR